MSAQSQNLKVVKGYGNQFAPFTVLNVQLASYQCYSADVKIVGMNQTSDAEMVLFEGQIILDWTGGLDGICMLKVQNGSYSTLNNTIASAPAVSFTGNFRGRPATVNLTTLAGTTSGQTSEEFAIGEATMIQYSINHNGVIVNVILDATGGVGTAFISLSGDNNNVGLIPAGIHAVGYISNEKITSFLDDNIN